MTYPAIDQTLRRGQDPATKPFPAKASFDDIYDAPDPGPYFSTLRPLDYRIPHFAQPVIRRLVAELRRVLGREKIAVLDLCSGYGVNGALLRHDADLDDLYRFYADDVSRSPEAARAALDPLRREDHALRIIGQDVAGRALAYAKGAGFVDAALQANLETDDLTAAQAEQIREADLVTITGGLSYIGKATLARILGALRRRPWILYFPLRGTDTRMINTTLAQAGLRPERWHRPLPQRRFADDGERRGVRATIGRSADGLGAASSTHQEAVLHLARPAGDARMAPISALVAGIHAGAAAS